MLPGLYIKYVSMMLAGRDVGADLQLFGKHCLHAEQFSWYFYFKLLLWTSRMWDKMQPPCPPLLYHSLTVLQIRRLWFWQVFNTSIPSLLGAQRSHGFCTISEQGLVIFRRGLRVTYLCINRFKPFLLLSMMTEKWPWPFQGDAELLSHMFLQGV